MKTSSRLVLNAVSQWVAVAIDSAVALLTIPFLIGALGKDAFGLSVLIGSVVVLIVLLDMGIRTAASRNLAEAVALGDEQRLAELASTTLVVYLAVGCFAALVCFALAPVILTLFKVQDRLVPDAVFLLRWYLPAMVFLQFVHPSFVAMLLGYNRFDIVNGVAGISSVCRLAALLVLVGAFKMGLPGWAAAMVLARSISCFLAMFGVRRLCPHIVLLPRYVQRKYIRPIVSLAVQVFVLRVSNVISAEAGPLVLGAFLGPAPVTAYTPGAKMSELLRNLAGVLNTQSYPVATEAAATGDSERLRGILFRGTRYTLLMGIPFCVFMGVFAVPIMHLWLGRVLGDDVLVAAKALQCWAVMDLFFYASGTQWAVLLATKLLWFLAVVRVIAALITIASSIVLVRYTSLAVMGVVIPPTVVMALRWPIASAYTARVCGVTMRRYIREAFVAPAGILVSLVALSAALRLFIPCNSLYGLASCACVTGIMWLCMVWFLVLRPQERREFRHIFLRSIGRSL